MIIDKKILDQLVKVYEEKHSNFRIYTDVELKDGTLIKNVLLLEYVRESPIPMSIEEDPFNNSEQTILPSNFYINSIGINNIKCIYEGSNYITSNIAGKLSDISDNIYVQNDGFVKFPSHIFVGYMSDGEVFNFRLENGPGTGGFLNLPKKYKSSDIVKVVENEVFFNGGLHDKDSTIIIENLHNIKFLELADYFECRIDFEYHKNLIFNTQPSNDFEPPNDFQPPEDFFIY